MALDLQDYVIDNILSDRQTFPAGTFSGQVVFQATTERRQAFKNLRDSYFVVGGTIATQGLNLSVAANTTTIPTVAFNNHFTQNPAAALFSNCQLYVNDVLVSSIVNWPTHLTHFKLMHESYNDQLSSGSPIIPYTCGQGTYSTATLGHAATVYSMENKLIAGKVINSKVLKTVGGVRYDYNTISHPTAARVYSYDTATGVVADACPQKVGAEFAISFPFPFLVGTEDEETMDLYGNCSLRVAFQISPTYNVDLIRGLSAAGDGAEAGSIVPANLTVHTFEWNIEKYTTTNPPNSMKLSRNFVEMISYRNSLLSNTVQWQIPSSTRRVAVSFMRKSTITTHTSDADIAMPARAITLAAGEVVASSTALDAEPLTRLYISFNGRVYPQKAYNITSNATSGSSLRRAYDDYLRFSESLPSGELNVLSSFEQWLQTPIFVFMVTGGIGDTKEAMLTVHVEGTLPVTMAGASAPFYDICITAEYVKQMNIDYDESGRPTTTLPKLVV